MVTVWPRDLDFPELKRFLLRSSGSTRGRRHRALGRAVIDCLRRIARGKEAVKESESETATVANMVQNLEVRLVSFNPVQA